jgi:hypothetical protein
MLLSVIFALNSPSGKNVLLTIIGDDTDLLAIEVSGVPVQMEKA